MMDTTHLTPMSGDESASLLFICGDQYLFRYREREGAMTCKFLSASTVRAAFSEEPIDTGWLLPTVRRCGMGKLGAWVMVAHPPQLYALSVLMRENAEPDTLQIPMPRLAFFGYGQRYYVWAFKEKELKGETIMFAAPLPNVDPNGAICFGSNVVPDASTQTIEGSGRWADGTWKVVFARPLAVPGPDRPTFRVHGETDLALAVWNGSSGDRNGKKMISSFVRLVLSNAAFPPIRVVQQGSPTVIWVLAATPFAAMFLFGGIAGLRALRRRP